MQSVNCIDVSYCQTGVDYHKVKSDGISAVIIRAGYGRETSQKDSEFETHYRNAKSAGLKIGAYWYSYADSVEDAKKEALACLACVKGKVFDLPIYYDTEENFQTKLGKATLTAMTIAFCDIIKSNGFSCGVYGNPNWFYNYLDYEKLKKSYSIWLAHWNTTYSIPCDIWQNSSNGIINGISGNVDTDIIINPNIINKTTNSTNSTNVSTSGNSNIKAVQSWLNANYKSGLEIDGIFGNLTKKALVKALQTELNKQYNANLVIDGIFGSKTKSAIRNISIGTISAIGNITKILQGLLICNGYSTNGFDGIFGIVTAAAVKSYQIKNNLIADGIAGKETFYTLCN